jgi:hypothetical protein
LPNKITLLQSKFFSRQIFLLYFGKGNFGGKKITLQKSEFTLQRRLFENLLEILTPENSNKKRGKPTTSPNSPH